MCKIESVIEAVSNKQSQMIEAVDLQICFTHFF